MKGNIPEVFCSQLRLAIMSCLLNQELLFNDLKRITEASDGNLSVQLKKMNEWGYIKSEKIIFHEKLVTRYRISDKGRKEFEDYVLFLENVLNNRY